MPVVNSNRAEQAYYVTEDSARPWTEIRRNSQAPVEWEADPQAHTMIKEDKDPNQPQSLDEIQAEISQLEAILEHSKDQLQSGSSDDKSITAICNEENTMPSRMVDEAQCYERAVRRPSIDTIPQTDHNQEAWRSELKAQIREEVDVEFRRQQDLQETYNQTFEKCYAELKRHEAEEQQLIYQIKEQAKAEFRREQEAANERAQEEKRLAEKIRRTTDTENAHVEAQRACQGHDSKEQFIQQFRDFSQDILTDPNKATLTQTLVQQCKVPSIAYDVMTFLTEGSETAPPSSWSSGAGSNHGDNSDDTEAASVQTGKQERGNMNRNRDVEGSQPWKGPAHLGSFIELTPFYVRGSDAGQTWYHGPEPVYIIEFQAGYDGDFAKPADVSNALQPRERPYLLVSQLWIDAEALDKFGFKYVEGPPSHFFLDPHLSWDTIEVLVNFTYALREVETFKKHGQACTAETKLFCRSPPPTEFFATSVSREVLHSTSLRSQGHQDEALEGKESAEEKPWTVMKRLAYALSVLNFFMHTIS